VIKALSVESWMAVHEATLRYGESQGLEKGRNVDYNIIREEFSIDNLTERGA